MFYLSQKVLKLTTRSKWLTHNNQIKYVAATEIQNKQIKYYSSSTDSHSCYNKNHVSHNSYSRNTRRNCLALLGATLIGGFYIYKKITRSSTLQAYQTPDKTVAKYHATVRNDLPTFKMEEVSKHSQSETGVWVTYGIGVYDITKFIPEHPGSDKIMLAAGSAVDPFWHIFQQHNTPEILELLESYRIGNLDAHDEVGTKDLFDPWSNEPKRHLILKPASNKPFNAEPPSSILVDSYFTPTEFFYVRNHLPVPDIDANNYELEIEIESTGTEKKLSFNDIKDLPKHSITATIMCGGNRRSEMHNVKNVKGLSWGAAAVGNAIWSGPKLCDVLRQLGVNSNETHHVHFEGLDLDPTSTPYIASIPLSKAMDPRGDVILAYEMNGKPLNRDHGYPVRVIVPGVVGARNVKWLGKIVVSANESDSHWQQNDYKGFSPSTDWDTVNFSQSPAIQNMPVTSAICTPQTGEKVPVINGKITVKGYAWSGGGNKIVRVDVTADSGETWHVANLEEEDDGMSSTNLAGRHWAWSLWTINIPIKENVSDVEIWSKAVDSNYNVQPESFKNTWNLRGVLSHAYSKVKLKCVQN